MSNNPYEKLKRPFMGFIPAVVCCDFDVSAMAKVFYSLIFPLQNERYELTTTYENLAEMSYYAEDRIKSFLNDLEQNNHLKYSHGDDVVTIEFTFRNNGGSNDEILS